MNVLRVLSILGLALVVNVGLAAGGAHASSPTYSPARSWGLGTASHATTNTVKTADGLYPGGSPGWYDINNYDEYCPAGGTTCATQTCGVQSAIHGTGVLCDSNILCLGPCSDFAVVAAVGPAIGATYGTPGFVNAGCDLLTPNGYISGGVTVETPAFGALWDDYYDSQYTDFGVITGKGTLLSSQTNEDTEDAPQATSSLAFSAYDPYSQVTVSVTGVQNTDNGSDTLNNGVFTITVHGVYSGGNTGLYSSNGHVTGTIRCQAGGPNATALGNYEGVTSSPNCFYGAEGELEDYPFYEYNRYLGGDNICLGG